MFDIFIKAVVLALVLLVAFAVVHAGMMRTDEEFSMSHRGIFAGVFVAGVVAHFMTELAFPKQMLCSALCQ